MEIITLFRLPRFVAVFADDVPNLFNMLPRIQGRPLGGVLAMIKMLQRLELVRGTGLLLAVRLQNHCIFKGWVSLVVNGIAQG